MTEQAFGRSIDNVGDVYRFAEEIFESDDIAQEVRFPIHLALEELFVNLVTYNEGAQRDISIDVETHDGGVTVTMTDHDAQDFDVTKSRDVDIKSTLEERKPGGLGLHLIQHMVDHLEYDYQSGRTKIRFTKESQQNDV